jgi:ABC-type branched-subunit amino acid transport system ATPase component
MLDVKGLHVSYGRAQVLFDVDLSAPSGSLVCLMGRNGVGKTTLLKAVTGILSVRSGTVTFDGRDITKMKVHDRVRLGLGYVPRALVTEPRMLLLDEPTEGIQPSIVHEIEAAIGQLHASGLTILLVEQYLELARRIADRFVILDAGEVVRAGNAEDLRDESVRGLLAV